MCLGLNVFRINTSQFIYENVPIPTILTFNYNVLNTMVLFLRMKTTLKICMFVSVFLSHWVSQSVSQLDAYNLS